MLNEKEKKTKQLQKKLDDIQKLKEKLAKGEKLEANQLAKIDKEDELIQEMKALQVEN